MVGAGSKAMEWGAGFLDLGCLSSRARKEPSSIQHEQFASALRQVVD